MRTVRRVLGIALFVAILVVGWRLASENSDTVSIHYLAGETDEVLLWAALLSAFALGALTISLVSALQWARLSMVARRYRKAVRKLEAEVHQLRNLPLAADAGAVPGEGTAMAEPSRDGALRSA